MNKLINSAKQVFKEDALGIYIMAFLIPLYAKWLGFAVLIIILEQIIRRTPIKKEAVKAQLTWRNPGVWLFAFYLMHVVGLIYTENMKFATMDLGMKSTVAIFPVFFALYQPVVRWRIFIQSFILGAFVSIGLNIYLVFDLFLEYQDFRYLRGSLLSVLMHRGYWAAYLLVAYFFLLQMIIASTSWKKITINIVGALVIASFILLSESRLGFLVLMLLSVWVMIKLVKVLKNKWIIPLLGTLFIGFGLLIYHFVPSAVKRVEMTIEKITASSEENNIENTKETDARILIWGTSYELVKEHFWWGVGTGDIKDELIQRYIDKGYTDFAELKFNSHNQFLNSHIALGIWGSFFLLLVVVTNCLKKKNDPLRTWRVGITIILFLAMLTESMMESQAGIIPYAFFFSFL